MKQNQNAITAIDHKRYKTKQRNNPLQRLLLKQSVLLYSRGRIKTEGFEKDDVTELDSV